MSLINILKQKRIEMLAALNRLKPIQQNKILFWSDLGKRYSCNPRHFSDYIRKNYPGCYDIVWMFDSEIKIPDDFPKNLRVVRFFSIEFLYEIATAKYVICNARMPKWFYFKKRKGQIYLQTWHSSLRLKAIEKDAEMDLSDRYIEHAKYDSSQISYILSGCEFSSKIFSKSFWYTGKLLEVGTPRIDYLIDQARNKNGILEKVGLDDSYHYVLYAPTFRKGDDMSAYDIDMLSLIEVLSQKFGGKWKVLYRLHPNMVERVKLEDLSECCVDMCHYHDMQELLILSDILITDYSSSMFDVTCLDKLCILYVSDLEKYIKNERKLYFGIEKLPFLIAHNNEELINGIKYFNEDDYKKKVKSFNQEIGSFEQGNSCERIYKALFD